MFKKNKAPLKRGKEKSFFPQKLIHRLKKKHSKELLAQILSPYSFDEVKDAVKQSHKSTLILRDYNSPIPFERENAPDSEWRKARKITGITIDTETALRKAKTSIAPYLQEFREKFPLHMDKEKHPLFHLLNGCYMVGDAHVYYAFIRHYKPNRIIEVGVGNSTVVGAEALAKNMRDDSSYKPQYDTIDIITPPLMHDIQNMGIDTSHQEADVTKVPLDFFTSLEAGDILFIDSSHILKEGSDVEYEILEILPNLSPGVIIHFHDINTPQRYQKCYHDMQWYWNEQYLLEAYLIHNSRIEIIWPSNYLFTKHREEMLGMFPEILDMQKKWPDSLPSSFWIKIKE